MANNFTTNKNAPGIVAKVFAKMLADKIQFVKAIDKEDESTFGKNFLSVQPGDTIYVNRPARFNIRTGSALTIQDVVEDKVALAVNQKIGVDVTVSSNQLATDIAFKSWAKRVLDPAASRLAQEVERLILTQAVSGTANLVGTPGTAVNAFLTYMQATQKLDENLAPMDNRKVLITPGANAATVDALKGLFQSSTEIANQYKSGYMGTAAGFDFLRNALLPTITNGTQAATGATVTTTSAEGATTLALTVTSGATINAGQVFTIAGVSAVHPITKVPYPYLAQFVATNSVTATGTALTGLTFVVDGQAGVFSSASNGLQNVSQLPTSTSAVVLVGVANTAYTQNIAFHPSAMRFCSVPLIMPDDVTFKAQETVDGITVRVLQQYQIADDTLPMRLDILFGGAVVRPEWLCRLTN